MSPLIRLLPIPLLVSLFAACAGEPGSPPPGEASARERLIQSPRQFGLFDDSAVSIAVALRGSDGWSIHPAVVGIEYGSIVLEAEPNGDLRLSSARVHLDDVMVGDKGLPPNGLHLTDIVLSTGAPHDCTSIEWSPDGDTCDADIPVQLDLDWSLVASDGAVVPLGTQELGPIALAVAVGGDDLGLSVELSARESGTLWTWAGMVEFRDLELIATGHELVPLAR